MCIIIHRLLANIEDRDFVGHQLGKKKKKNTFHQLSVSGRKVWKKQLSLNMSSLFYFKLLLSSPSQKDKPLFGRQIIKFSLHRSWFNFMQLIVRREWNSMWWIDHVKTWWRNLGFLRNLNAERWFAEAKRDWRHRSGSKTYQGFHHCTCKLTRFH